jgi:hypothetical protein
MHIDYEVSEQDFMQAHNLALKNYPSPLVRWIPHLMPLGGLAGIAFLAYAWYSQGFKMTLIWGSLFCWWFISIPFMMRRGKRKAYANSKSFHGPISMDTDERGIRFKANGTESQTAWANFASFFEDDKSFVISQGNTIFQPIPKRLISAEQINELRECLKQNIG